MGGASDGGVPAAGFQHYGVPTEEFPGGIDLVPVRHYVPSMPLDPPISPVTCSFEPVSESFVEPAEAGEHLSIDESLAGSEVEELAQSTSEKSFMETSCGTHPTAVPPPEGPDYWRPEGHYGSDHNPGHGWTWYPWLSYPQVVVPDWAPPSPGGAMPSPDYEPEEVEQPTVNGDHGSARGGGFYLDDRYGVDITPPALSSWQRQHR
ncbi:hypothetical protein CYMTET_54751 [Cymbomonas tetramitiformis]|uniref:Uncharacterized protein n=1 Tax=Cymbomonas tetramitiformis TaxID=36881 RepID=A0AAE0EQE7_9CHLO|nr:hypothetical protein CYMTET_54751 [Cymbomonas tetramitiformis]